MLPTRLNLLPPDKQRHLQRMIRSEFMRSSLGVSIIVLSIIGMALLGGRSVLESYFSDLASTIHAVNMTSKDKNMQVQLVNTRVKTAEAVLTSEYYWPTILTNVAATVPRDVVLSRVTLDRKADGLTLTGRAETRDSLLAFGEALRGLDGVTLVDIPIGQLTEREDINFTIRVEMVY